MTSYPAAAKVLRRTPPCAPRASTVTVPAYTGCRSLLGEMTPPPSASSTARIRTISNRYVHFAGPNIVRPQPRKDTVTFDQSGSRLGDLGDVPHRQRANDAIVGDIHPTRTGSHRPSTCHDAAPTTVHDNLNHLVGGDRTARGTSVKPSAPAWPPVRHGSNTAAAGTGTAAFNHRAAT